MPKTVGVAVSNATFHFDKLYTYAVLPEHQNVVRLGSMGLPFSCRKACSFTFPQILCKFFMFCPFLVLFYWYFRIAPLPGTYIPHRHIK